MSWCSPSPAFGHRRGLALLVKLYPGPPVMVQHRATQPDLSRLRPVQGGSPASAEELFCMQVYGEDFQDFMHRGATQCTSCHAYVDLFCYQAPSSR